MLSCLNGGRREVKGWEPRSVFRLKTSAATILAGRLGDVRVAHGAKPPMALRVGFAEMPQADGVSYLCAPSVVPVSIDVRSARCRMTFQWENKTCFRNSGAVEPDPYPGETTLLF